MNRGQLYIDSTPNEIKFVSEKRVLETEEEPVLIKKDDEEKEREEEKEQMEPKTAYNILVDEMGDVEERDDYEEERENNEKVDEIQRALDIAQAGNDEETVVRLQALLDELKREEAGEEEGDAPSVEGKEVKELLNDFHEALGTNDKKVMDAVFNNVNAKLASDYQKGVETNAGNKMVKDPVVMHEYAKMVHASYEFFKHRDFSKVKEYMNSSDNAYVPGFNQWQVNEQHSSADDLVFVKYGRDLNNPKVVIACRGTATSSDWITNANMVAGGTEQTNRFKNLERTFYRLRSQFPDSQIEVTGHSQGGGLSYALAQKYNLRGYHYDPAVFPAFRHAAGTANVDKFMMMENSFFNQTANLINQTAQTWTQSALSRMGVSGNIHSSRQQQFVYKNSVDPVSMMMTLLDSDKNVSIRTVDVKNVNGQLGNPHSLDNYHVSGYSGDVSQGVSVSRGGNTEKMLEPLLKRAGGMYAVRKTGNVGGAVAVGMTVNDTYHAVKRIEQDSSLSRREKKFKEYMKVGTNVADFAISAQAGFTAEAAAAALLAGMGTTGAIAVGAPLLAGAAAAIMASYAVKWIGGNFEKHADVLSRMVSTNVEDVVENVNVKKRKRNNR